MIPLQAAIGVENGFPEDELFRLQKLTAQRADELRGKEGASQSGDLALWLQAEAEVLERYQPLLQ